MGRPANPKKVEAARLRNQRHPPFGGKKIASSYGGVSHFAPYEISPWSRTGFSRLSYNIKDLPELYIIEVETFSDVSKTPPQSAEAKAAWIAKAYEEWKHVLNPTARYEALKEILKEELKDIAHLVTINMAVSRYVDHIIIPTYGLRELKIELQEVSDQELTLTVKQTVNGVDQNMRCVLMEARLCADNRRPELYWKSLEAVVRHRAIPTGSEKLVNLGKADVEPECPRKHGARFGMDREFFRTMEDAEPLKDATKEDADPLENLASINPYVLDRKSTRLNSSHLVISYASAPTTFTRSSTEATPHQLRSRRGLLV